MCTIYPRVARAQLLAGSEVPPLDPDLGQRQLDKMRRRVQRRITDQQFAISVLGLVRVPLSASQVTEVFERCRRVAGCVVAPSSVAPRTRLAPPRPQSAVRNHSTGTPTSMAAGVDVPVARLAEWISSVPER